MLLFLCLVMIFVVCGICWNWGYQIGLDDGKKQRIIHDTTK